MALEDRSIEGGALKPVIAVLSGGLPAGTANIGNVTVEAEPQIEAQQLLSAQVAVAAAGTAVQGPNLPCGAHGLHINFPDIAGNTGKIGYVGNDGAGDVTSANGYIMLPGKDVWLPVSNANLLYFDGSDACTFSLIVG